MNLVTTIICLVLFTLGCHGNGWGMEAPTEAETEDKRAKFMDFKRTGSNDIMPSSEYSDLENDLDNDPDKRAKFMDFKRAKFMDFKRPKFMDFKRAKFMDFKRPKFMDFKRAKFMDFKRDSDISIDDKNGELSVHETPLADDEEKRAKFMDFKRAKFMDFKRPKFMDFKRAKFMDFKRPKFMDFKRAKFMDFKRDGIAPEGDYLGSSNDEKRAKFMDFKRPRNNEGIHLNDRSVGYRTYSKDGLENNSDRDVYTSDEIENDIAPTFLTTKWI